MTLPNQLRSARMTDATTGDRIDNDVGDLETALSDVLGIPIDTAIANKLFTVVANGLLRVHLQDLASDPTAIGELVRNVKALKFHNGLHAGSIPLVIDKNSTAVTVANRLDEVQLYLKALGDNLLGTTGRLRFVAIGTLTIRPIHIVRLRFNWAGVQNVLEHLVVGGNTTQRTTDWRWVIELFMNGATNSWRVMSTVFLNAMEQSSGSDHVGLNSANGPSSESRGFLSGSVDLATSRAFQVSALWNQADAANSLQYYHSTLEVLP